MKLGNFNFETDRYAFRNGMLIDKESHTLLTVFKYEDVIVPDDVTKIGDYAFIGNSSMQSIVISDGVTEIGRGAFDECKSLQSIVVPDSVTKIGEFAFKGCTALQSIVIPDGVTEIGYGTFHSCSSLQNIDIPDGVTEIGEYAFFGCKSLQSIVIPTSVTEIGEDSFDGCSSLKSVSIGNASIRIGKAAFYNCPALVEVELPKGLSWSKVKSKFKGSPWGENGPTNKAAQQSLETLARGIFADCEATITNVGTKLQIDATLPNGCIVAGIFTIDNKKGKDPIDWDALKAVKQQAADCTAAGTLFFTGDSIVPIKDITNPSKVVFVNILFPITDIPSNCFRDCTSLQSFDIPDGVTKIGKEAFKGCTSLRRVNIPDSVTKISEFAFIDCTSIDNIVIPNGVTKIYVLTFYGCSSLKTISFPESITEIDGSAFSGTAIEEPIIINGTLFYLPPAMYVDGNCVIPDGVTTIVYGSISDEKGDIKSIHLPASTIKIGSNGFSSLENLVEVTLNEGLTTIDCYAFENCKTLKSISLPESVTLVDKLAFGNCKSLTTITIGNPEITIGTTAFKGCTAVTEVVLPKGLTWNKVKNKFKGSPWGENGPTQESAAPKASKASEAPEIIPFPTVAYLYPEGTDRENNPSKVVRLSSCIVEKNNYKYSGDPIYQYIVKENDCLTYCAQQLNSESETLKKLEQDTNVKITDAGAASIIIPTKKITQKMLNELSEVGTLRFKLEKAKMTEALSEWIELNTEGETMIMEIVKA